MTKKRKCKAQKKKKNENRRQQNRGVDKSWYSQGVQSWYLWIGNMRCTKHGILDI